MDKPGTKPPSIEELTKQLEAVTAQYENSRRAQAGVDTAFQREKKRADELEARLIKGQSEAQILARLDAIQKGYAARERKLELAFYAKSKALDSGIDYALISDIDFKDEPAIERKVSQIAQAVTAQSLDELDRRLMQSTPPRAGNGSRPRATPLDGIVSHAMQGIGDDQASESKTRTMFKSIGISGKD